MGDVMTMLTQAGWNLIAILAKGGLVMVPLLVSSMLSLAVVLERCLFWRRCRKYEDGGTILSLVAAGHLAQAMQTARASRHPLSTHARYHHYAGASAGAFGHYHGDD